MNYSAIKNYSIENGLGVRVSLFVCGCNRHCLNCHNPKEQDFTYGSKFTKITMDEIFKDLDHDYIQGLSILGGEPLEHANVLEVQKLVYMLRQTFGDSKDVWLYTGYTMEQLFLRCKKDAVLTDLLASVDVIVDGAYIETLKQPDLTYRGSTNQRILNAKESIKQRKAILYDY